MDRQSKLGLSACGRELSGREGLVRALAFRQSGLGGKEHPGMYW